MTTPRPGSILLGTTQPAELRDWYRRTLAPAHNGDGPIDLGGLLLVIEQRDDVDARNNEPGRMILSFHVDDFDAVEAQLRAAGVDSLAPVADRSIWRSLGSPIDQGSHRAAPWNDMWNETVSMGVA
jgi:hypothetical protein